MKPNLIAKLFQTLNIVLILNLIRTRGRELFPSNSSRRWVKTDECMGGQLPEFAKFKNGGTAGSRRRPPSVKDTAPEAHGGSVVVNGRAYLCTFLLGPSGPLRSLLFPHFHAKMWKNANICDAYS